MLFDLSGQNTRFTISLLARHFSWFCVTLVPLSGRAEGSETETTMKLWSLQGVLPPNVEDTPWAQSPIDSFIPARLEKGGLQPSPPADKRTLLRRITFDLTGLPPTPAQVMDFLSDTSPSAFSKVIDRLLSSPRYGERFGRHWLDIARYAETRRGTFSRKKHATHIRTPTGTTLVVPEKAVSRRHLT